ncbi:MAG: STAS domain-containing protein [Bacteroidales bacterium]|nr:STAS domain-containing protein [Bacteroidales bacterium]MBN2747960.1 STAS domain-containing protein [Bacteroidales bacterium]
MNSIFKPKLFTVLKEGYSRHQLQSDIMAGIIVGIVALPLAIAFAIASGVSPEKGLVTAIIASLVISVLGGSRVQISGPTVTFAMVIFAVVQQYGLEGVMITTFLAGLMLIGFGVLKLGAIIKFIPHPLVVGFTSGIAVIIFTTQVKDFLGLTIEHIPAGFAAKWGTFFHNLSNTNIYALAIGVGTALISIYSKKVLKKVPGSFIAIILTTLVVAVFKLPVSTIGSTYGEIQTSISLSFPNFDLSTLANFVAPAFTVAILCSIESLLSAVVSDGMISGHHRSNTELVAQGIANVILSVTGGIPASGVLARTATNVKNGGRTPVAGIMHAVTLLLIALFFGKWAAQIPLACLAGILVVVAYNMSEWRSFYSILKGSTYDIIVLLTTFFLTIFVDLTTAIQIGMVLASLLFMQRMSKTSQIYAPESESDALEDYSDLPKGVDVYEINGPFFFAAAQKYRETIQELGTKSKVLILRMRHVPFIDATGVHNFRETVKYLEDIKVTLILSGVQPDVKAELEKARVDFLIGRNNICSSYSEAKHKATKIVEERFPKKH